MTPKMTVKVTPKMTPKKAKNDTQKVKNVTQGSKNDTQEAKDDTKNSENDTKNDTKKNIYIDDTQEVKNVPTISMTPKMTPRIKEWNYMFLKQTSEIAVKSSIIDCFGNLIQKITTPPGDFPAGQ